MYLIKIFSDFCSSEECKLNYERILLMSLFYNNFHGELQQGKYVDQTLREYFPDLNYKGIF